MPRQQRLPRHLRPGVNLRVVRTLLATTVWRRQGPYSNYEAWVAEGEGHTIRLWLMPGLGTFPTPWRHMVSFYLAEGMHAASM